MKMKYLIGLVLCMFAGTVGAQNKPHVVPPAKIFGFESGNELLVICRSPTDADKSACSAYVEGVVDLIVVLQAWGTWKYKAVCLPEEAINGQVRDVVVKYLVENPAERNRAAASLIMFALIDAWGCPAS